MKTDPNFLLPRSEQGESATGRTASQKSAGRGYALWGALGGLAVLLAAWLVWRRIAAERGVKHQGESEKEPHGYDYLFR